MKKCLNYIIFFEIIFIVTFLSIIKTEYYSKHLIVEQNISEKFVKMKSELYALTQTNLSPNEIERYFKLTEGSADTKQEAIYNYGINLYDESGNVVIKYLYKTDSLLEKKIIDISKDVKNKNLISKHAWTGYHEFCYAVNDEFKTRGYSLYFQTDKKKMNLFIIKSMATSIFILSIAQIVIIFAFVMILKKNLKNQ